jgi:hypothetical protein
MATPANSPCAPAMGVRLTACMPVISCSISCSSYMHARKPCGSGPSGCRPKNSGSIAKLLHTLGLYFMVHEPSG